MLVIVARHCAGAALLVDMLNESIQHLCVLQSIVDLVLKLPSFLPQLQQFFHQVFRAMAARQHALEPSRLVSIQVDQTFRRSD